MKIKSKNIFIRSEDKIISALNLMDQEKVSLLIVMNDDKFYGVISMGDVQRSIIKFGTVEVLVKDCIRKDIVIARSGQSIESIKLEMAKYHTEFMPVLCDNELESIIFWEDVFDAPFMDKKPLSNVPVVIMAGGFGSRLKPLTNVIPKPMVPLGDRTIMEHIISQFEKEGCDQFFATVNYKSEMLKFYFDGLDKEYSLGFIEENVPLGTGGSLAYLKGKIDNTFFVSNCDILLDQKMSSIYDYHKAYGNKITIVSSIMESVIPYGTLETCEGGKLKSMQEKPTDVYQINTGVYILEPSVLDYIEEDTFQHITDIISLVCENGGQVGVFPVSERSWHDIGQWEEYQKTQIEFENKVIGNA